LPRYLLIAIVASLMLCSGLGWEACEANVCGVGLGRIGRGYLLIKPMRCLRFRR
jgi:hypothetical protein